MSSKALLDKGLDFPLLFLKGFDGLFVPGTRCARASYSFHRPSERNPLVQHLLTKKRERSIRLPPYEPFVLGFEIRACSCITAGV